MTLTHKQRLFVEAYIANGGNGTRAAEAAGYSNRCLGQQATENLQKPAVAAAIREQMGHLLTTTTRQARRKRPCFVYVIAAPSVARYKIGITRQAVAKRMSALQTGSPVPLKLVTTLPGGLAEEARLHERFAAQHTHGEWFALTQQDLDWLQRYADERPAPHHQDATLRRGVLR